MTSKLSMQHAERLPTLPSPRTMVVPVVALVIGAAAATGAFALLDHENTGSQATAPKVIIAEPPAQPGPGVGAKDEAGVAAAIGSVAPATRYDGGPEEGTRGIRHSSAASVSRVYVNPSTGFASPGYDGGPEE